MKNWEGAQVLDADQLPKDHSIRIIPSVRVWLGALRPSSSRPALRWPIICVGLVLLASDPAAALEQVSMQLKWTHQFQFAGYYAALEQGFYRDAGLDVAIREGGPGIDVADEVANGNADFGVCSA